MTVLTIGKLGRETGVKVPTIRFYESIGLLPLAGRTKSNRRIYGYEAVRRLRFIRHARELGFELSQIRQLLQLADNPRSPCHEVDAIARTHLEGIESRVKRLVALRTEVKSLLGHCTRGTIRECRVMEGLSGIDGLND